MSRLGFLEWSEDFDEFFNQPLSHALDKWDPGHSGYGEGRWTKIRAAKVPAGMPHAGEYALDDTAQQLIRDDYKEQHPPPPPYPSLVYPHDKNFQSVCGGFLHQTGGISGNWAYDFLAGPGTPVLAPEDGTVSRTSGHDPSSGLHGSNQDVFGWSIYLKCTYGFYYATHFGRLTVAGGEKVRVGEVMGYVGDWPHDRPRSHTHLGYTNFTHVSRLSINKIRAVAAGPRVDGREIGV
jgi:murein DD-endopeptidase MepM/ murein hydrolase activator NlpD